MEHTTWFLLSMLLPWKFTQYPFFLNSIIKESSSSYKTNLPFIWQWAYAISFVFLTPLYNQYWLFFHFIKNTGMTTNHLILYYLQVQRPNFVSEIKKITLTRRYYLVYEWYFLFWFILITVLFQYPILFF